jgi:hypothetical protein
MSDQIPTENQKETSTLSTNMQQYNHPPSSIAQASRPCRVLSIISLANVKGVDKHRFEMQKETRSVRKGGQERVQSPKRRVFLAPNRIKYHSYCIPKHPQTSNTY